MIPLTQPPSQDPTQKWRSQLNKFVKEQENSLAALCWGLRQEWGAINSDVLGIDLQPQPHFVRCSRESLELLNEKLDKKIQEILGILDGHNPQEEVVMIAMSTGQVKLIYFCPPLPPAECFATLGKGLDDLIQELESSLAAYLA